MLKKNNDEQLVDQSNSHNKKTGESFGNHLQYLVLLHLIIQTKVNSTEIVMQSQLNIHMQEKMNKVNLQSIKRTPKMVITVAYKEKTTGENKIYLDYG